VITIKKEINNIFKEINKNIRIYLNNKNNKYKIIIIIYLQILKKISKSLRNNFNNVVT
jgi:hypothetical protein